MLLWGCTELNWTWMEEGVFSGPGDDVFLYLSCFQQSSDICWVWALAPEEMTEKTKLWRRYGQNVKSSQAVLLLHCQNSAAGRTYRGAEVPLPLLLAHILNPLLLVLSFALFWRCHHLFGGKLGLCVSAPQDFTALQVLRTSRVQVMTVSSREENWRGKREQKSLSFGFCIVSFGWIYNYLLVALLPVLPLGICVSYSQPQCETLKPCNAFKLMRVQWISSGYITQFPEDFCVSFMAYAS